jgi:cytoskeleton protein RodZ
MGSLGARLKQQREQRKITLDDISTTTKISTRLLRAIEDEHFDQLPGGIFNKGFIRAYARHVGMNEDEAVAAYLEASGEAEVTKEAPGQESFPLQIPREKLKPPIASAADIPWSMLALALIVLAIAFASWNFYTRQKNAASDSQPPAPQAPISADASQKSAPELLAASQPTSAARVASPAAAGSFSVLIKAQQDCWISIRTDSKPSVQETLSAGAQRTITGTRQIEIKAGNIGALTLLFNGQKLPVQGDYGEVKTLSFGPDGLEVTTTSPASAPVQP